MGDLSLNFSRWEFVCKHCGELVGPTAPLLRLLQAVRTDVGRPLRVVSGYRCPVHNAAVGGSKRSQHLGGRAADVEPDYAAQWRWRHHGTIGMGLRRNRVVHVDVRPGRQPFTFED